MENRICFLCHPYHRGGVTQWMANAFNVWNARIGNASFVTIKPRSQFISALERPEIISLLDQRYSKNVLFSSGGRIFELSNVEYRAKQYSDLLKTFLPVGVPVVPSDDESCWMAAATCSDTNPMIAVLHADEEVYFKLVDKYKQHIYAFVCVSQRILNTLLRRYPEFATRALALPCGILVENYNPAAAKEDVIVWAGRLSKYQKRAQDIIPIFKDVQKTLPGHKLVVMGTGDYFDAIKAEVGQDMEPAVSFTGWVSEAEIANILSQSKILLQTSDFEGTSVAMMEALASGCAIVSSRVSGVEDLESLEDAKNTIYCFNAGDVPAAAQKIHEASLASNTVTAQQARKLAVENFDCYSNSKKLLTFLGKVFASPRHASALKLKRVRVYLGYFLAVVRSLKIALQKNRK